MTIQELHSKLDTILDDYTSYVNLIDSSLKEGGADDRYLRTIQRSKYDSLSKISICTERYVNQSKKLNTRNSEEYQAEHRKLDNLFDELLNEVQSSYSSISELVENMAEEICKCIDKEVEEDHEIEPPKKPELETLPSGAAFAFGAKASPWVGYVGKRGGKGWRNVQTGEIVYGGEKPGSRGIGDDNIPGAGGTNVSSVKGTSGRLEEETGRSDSAQVDRTGVDTGKPTDTGPNKSTNESETRKQQIDRITKGFNAYAKYFRDNKQAETAEWIESLRDHVLNTGAGSALDQLGEERGERSNTIERVAYKGTGYFEPGNETKFLKKYLESVGITLSSKTRAVTSQKVIASAPTIGAQKSRKEGDVIAAPTNIETKLEESKLLPGLESTEDIHKLMGKNVTNFTPDVIDKLDETYGKGKWIIKSYGDEAYAGFGVFFPQRLKEIKSKARQTVYENRKKLEKLGYTISRDEDGKVQGIVNKSTNQVYKFATQEYNSIPNEKVKKLGNIISGAAPDEIGATLPGTAEDSLRQNYGVILQKNKSGKVIGAIDNEGKYTPRDSKGWKAYEEWDQEIGHKIERAITAAENKYAPDARFFAQPAFQAVGVSDRDRALGYTWETGTEGRVHATTKNGKASIIPYATLGSRYDAFPAVFYNNDIREMERVVQETIDALPESERAGQVYAPDVIKTKDGWKVVELNAASEFGQSLWLEENPFIIDAFVSHVSGREPNHARFIRDLLLNRESETKFKRSKPSKPAPTTKPEPKPTTQPESTEQTIPEQPTSLRKGGFLSLSTSYYKPDLNNQ